MGQINTAAFTGRLGIVRIISLVGGFLVFVVTFFLSFNIPSLSWYGLFGFLISITYLAQIAWAIILLLDVFNAVDQQSVHLIDGGLNTVCGGVVSFVGVWWILVFHYWHSGIFFVMLGHKEEYSCSYYRRHFGRDAAVCPQAIFDLGLAGYLFAILHGVASVLLGNFLFKSAAQATVNPEPVSGDLEAKQEQASPTNVATSGVTVQSEAAKMP